MATNNIDDPPVDFTSPPWVLIPGIANFRDIGGYPIANGTGSVSLPPVPHPSCLPPCLSSEAHYSKPQVRKGLIYRCADPSKVTEAGKEKLRSLGVKKIYDLRSEPELKRLGDFTKLIEIEGVERLFVPIIRTEDYSPQ